MESIATERIMTIDEVAKELEYARITVRKALEGGEFPNAKKVPVKEGSKKLRWDIPESDVLNFQKPKVGPPAGNTKSPDEVFGRRHITLEPDVDQWLERRQAAEPGFKVSEFINGLLREAMSREEY